MRKLLLKVLFYLLLFKKAFYLFVYPLFTGARMFRPIRLAMENYLIFQPAKLRAQKVDKSLLKKFIPQRFVTKDGARLYAWYFPPKENRPVVLFFHGQAESILSHQDVAKYCLKHDLGLFMLSYRGHYKSWGLPSEKGVYLDAQTALERIEELGTKRENVIVWGHSLGTTVAMETAKNNDVKALILQSPIKDIKSAAIDISKFYFKRLRLYTLRAISQHLIKACPFIQKFDNVSKISKVKCPILIMHSKSDRIAPYYNSMALANENEKAELFLSRKGNHWLTDWCLNRVTEFIEKITAADNTVLN